MDLKPAQGTAGVESASEVVESQRKRQPEKLHLLVNIVEPQRSIFSKGQGLINTRMTRTLPVSMLHTRNQEHNALVSF